MVAGVKILSALRPPSITASAPMINSSFLGSKWNSEELISMFESDPLIN